MKKVFLGIIIGLLAGGVAVWSFLAHRTAGEKHEAPEEHKEESRLHHGTNGETILKMEHEAQEKMGLEVAALPAAEFAPEIKAFGRVLDPSPLSAALSEISLASTQLDGSTRELERTRILFGQNQNVSARAVEITELTVQRDRLMLEAARTRFASSWGPWITRMDGLDDFVQGTVAHTSALVRVDIPPGDVSTNSPIAARVALSSAADQLMEAKLLGAAIAADPQVQGQGYLMSVKKGLPVGANLVALLSFPGEKKSGVIVPRDAIVRHEGKGFVYVQTGDETFERREIELDHPLDKGWFTGELKPNVKLVVTGGQQLLSEELKGEGGGE